MLAIYTSCPNGRCSNDDGERIAAIIFGFIATILYAVEVYFHQENAPSPTSKIRPSLHVGYFGISRFLGSSYRLNSDVYR